MQGKRQRDPGVYEVEWEVWVENRLGVHARPAAQIMHLASQFDATVILEKDGFQANARELLSLLALDSPQGTRLVIRASGPEAREAAQALAHLFARKFGEP
jgi:phosphotransferase system HPr (HPr) family protein|uniref:HPr family phosphocarrier protein n=1 Tax=Desulfobacca acetoxidans TaxID=60893 RepID=A0A7C3WT26_9BACT